MADTTTWVKIDRNILNWRWYQDGNTARVFLHLLLTANIKDHDFQTDTIHRGEVATSIGHIAKALDITYSQARTAIYHLIDSKEIASRKRPKYLVFTVLNYEKYQGVARSSHDASQANRTIIASASQQSKNNKNEKKEKNNTATSVTADLEDYGGIFLTRDQADEIERAVGPGVMVEYIDKVAEWLEENPRQKKTHVNVLRKFLRNDGLIK